MIKFNLEKNLDILGITRNKLSVLSEIRPNTINDLANGNSKRIEIETIEKILNTINELAIMRGVNKVFYIGDIVEYVPDNENIIVEQTNKLLTHESFEKIKEILSKNIIFTPITGLEETNMLEMISVFEDHIRRGIYHYTVISAKSPTQQINSQLYNISPTLSLYGLIESKMKNNDEYFTFSPKGNYFMELYKRESE